MLLTRQRLSGQCRERGRGEQSQGRVELQQSLALAFQTGCSCHLAGSLLTEGSSPPNCHRSRPTSKDRKSMCLTQQSQQPQPPPLPPPPSPAPPAGSEWEKEQVYGLSREQILPPRRHPPSRHPGAPRRADWHWQVLVMWTPALPNANTTWTDTKIRTPQHGASYCWCDSHQGPLQELPP